LGDDALVNLLKEDDEAAFSMLYLRHWDKMFLVAAKVLRSQDDAMDVVQDVFFSIWRRRRDLPAEASLAAYLRTSTKYAAIDLIRKDITRNDYLTILVQLAEGAALEDPNTLLQLKEIQKIVDRTVSAMSPKMREVYQLSRRDQLSHKEIAERMEISSETVKKHIQNALQLIRSAMSESPIALITLLDMFFFHK
jgi:RNA polymerase sigma-70 factor (ECF subfamily)